jgi:hypothetical protein
VPHTVNLDLSALGTFSIGTEITLDASTDPSQGPAPQQVTPVPHMQIGFTGYGVTMAVQ